MRKQTTIITLLAVVTIAVPASAINILEPGYTVETYATYSTAGVRQPSGMTFDNNGNLYATDRGTGTVWKITPDGTASQWVTSIDDPVGIEWAGGTSYGDYLYVVNYETLGGGVIKVAADGTTLPFGSMPYGGHAPGPLGLDRTGNYGGYMFVASTGKDHTYKVDLDGNITLWSDFPGWTDGGGPTGIEFDPGTYGGAMLMTTAFISSPSNSGLFSLTTDGSATGFSPDIASALGLKFDEYGLFDLEMFVIGKPELNDPWSLWRVGPDGAATEFATTTLELSRGLAFGPDGAMYLAEYFEADEMVVVSRVIPEPATIFLLGLGALVLRRKQ